MKTCAYFLMILCLSPIAAGQRTLVDECGILKAGLEPCYVFETFDGPRYEVKGDVGSFGDGDTVRIVGDFHIDVSLCMSGSCCLHVDSIESCSVTPPTPGVPSTSLIGIILLVVLIGLVALWRLRRPGLFFRT